MTFGEKLSKLRKENNFTQEQLADILNVSRQSVSKWESNITYPETEKLICLSKLFKCSTDYLLKDECENAVKDIKTTQIIPNHQKIIGFILLTVSLVAVILALLLAQNEESLLLTLIISATLLACSLICLLIKQYAGYWCAFAGFAPFIILSPHMVGMNLLFGINITVIGFYIIMFFVAKKIFKATLKTNRKKSRLLILSWGLFLGTHLYIYIIPFFIKEGFLVNPMLYIQLDFVSYIIASLLMTYTVCYVKSLNSAK